MLLENISKFANVVNRDGWSVAMRKVAGRLTRTTGVSAIFQPKCDSIAHFEHILGQEQGFGLKITPDNVPAGSMTWVIPDFEASSGGHINILRMMHLLAQRGFAEQHVVIVEPHRWSSQEEAQSALNNAFGSNGITVSLGAHSIEPCQYLVATGWQTAYWVAKYRDAAHRLYFVQDFEPAFYAHGSEYILAENTYRLGLTGVTAGSWLARKLADEYGMETFSYTFACDTALYRPLPRRPSKIRHIFFYARPVTPRRCFELGLLALKKVCDRNPDVAVIFAGWDVSNYEIPFHHLNAGSVSLDELPDLYSQCDVALVLSSTNLSLLPLEIAACGCPLVINRGPQSDWLLGEDEACYCDNDIESIAESLEYVLQNPRESAARAKAALARARAGSWEIEAEKVANYLRGL